MSGKKQATITVDLSYLRSLENKARQTVSLAAQNAALNDLSNAINIYMHQQETRVHTLNDRIAALNTELQQRDRAASEARRKLREQLEAVVNETNEVLASMNNTFNEALDKQRKETVDMINESNRHLTDALNSAVTTLQTNINTVNQRVNNIESDIAGLIGSNAELLELADEYRETAAVINRDTAENFRTELLLPGRLDLAQHALRLAVQHIDDCAVHPINASVARDKAREAAEAAIQLHQEMVAAEQEWQAHLEGARNLVALIAQQLEASRKFKLPAPKSKDPRKRRSDFDVDVNFWSNGTLDTLKERLDALKERLSGDNPYNLTMEEVDELSEAAEQISREISEAVTFSTTAATSSQSRVDYVGMMYRKLRSFAAADEWEIAYEGKDQRSALRAHITNPTTGFSFVITATPRLQDDGTICNDIETDILDYGTNNQAEADAVAIGIANALAGKTGGNIEVSEIATLDGYEHRTSDDSQLSDISSWEKQQNPAVPSPASQSKPSTQISSGKSPAKAPEESETIPGTV